jgi:uncharacterized damage-inducible protein DinB
VTTPAAPNHVGDLLLDAFSRVRSGVHGAVEGLDPDSLTLRIDDEANSISWLVWHTARIQDDHICALTGAQQVWVQGWYERFDVPFDRTDTGYGHTKEQVAACRPSADHLLGYYDAVHAATEAYLRTIRSEELDRIVDERWDPPVTLAVRLVSVITDNLEHVGQAAYVRGIAQRRHR